MKANASAARRLIALLIMISAFVWARPAEALPATVSSQGVVTLTGSEDAMLRLELSGSENALRGFTIGLFELDGITAAPGDLNFALQALRADRVTLLREAGQSVSGRIDLPVTPGRQLGLFLLRDATLEDFSLGVNPWQPIFSLPSAPGSSLLGLDFDSVLGHSIFTYYGIEPGRVIGAGGWGNASTPLFSISISSFEQQNPPVVPEPATLALAALGLGLSATLRRRKK